MADFTQSIPEPIEDLPTLAGLLQFWNEEVCKKEKAGKSFIYSVMLATDGPAAGKNVVFFKDTESEPLEPKLLRDFPGTLSEDEVENQIAGIEEKENLVVRSHSIVLLGGEKKWVAFFDAAPAPAPVPVPVPPSGPAPVASFVKTLARVSNRGVPPPQFLQELVQWAKTAPPEIFEAKPPPPNETDVYASVQKELGPYGDALQRKACMLEIMRVLAGFESSWKWPTGRDTTNASENSPDTISAGPFQVSANSLVFGEDLRALVKPHGIENSVRDGDKFQALMKTNHPVAFEYIARLLRHTIRHNGPVKRGEINEWLSTEAVKEFQQLLAT